MNIESFGSAVIVFVLVIAWAVGIVESYREGHKKNDPNLVQIGIVLLSTAVIFVIFDIYTLIFAFSNVPLRLAAKCVMSILAVSLITYYLRKRDLNKPLCNLWIFILFANVTQFILLIYH